MNSTSPFIDGRRFLAESPFRSAYFLVATALGLSTVVLAIAILYRNRNSAHEQSLVLVVGLAFIQLIYQWWRILRYYSRIRSLYAERPENEAREGSPLDLALRTATGGLIDLLFYCYGIALLLLALIAFR
jgi:hypothetical protein